MKAPRRKPRPADEAQEGPPPSPSPTSEPLRGVDLTQLAVGPRAAPGPVLQRTIQIQSGDAEGEYGVEKIPDLVKALQAAGLGDRLKSLGKVLAKWCGGGSHTFQDLASLVVAAEEAVAAGQKMQVLGARREEEALGLVGGDGPGKPREGCGLVLKRPVGQDPILKDAESGENVRLDLCNDSVWGLVGGGAKAKDEAAMKRELERVATLVKFCKRDGRHTAHVVYQLSVTPSDLMRELIKGVEVLGAQVTVEQSAPVASTSQDAEEGK